MEGKLLLLILELTLVGHRNRWFKNGQIVGISFYLFIAILLVKIAGVT
jgi:hypothetical protein